MRIGPFYLFCDMQPKSSGKLLAAWHRQSSITWTWGLYWHPAWQENKKWRAGKLHRKAWNMTMGSLGSINFTWQGRMARIERTHSHGITY